ncbi:MAG: hypothetical protein K2J08_02070 [Ruminococcus sp.]|nr:hypothetical protein [Ruminococcus sp.]
MNLHDMIFASKISGKSTGNADLSNYYTKSQTNSLIDGKVDKVAGKSLSTNDFTTTLKNKLDGLSNYDDTKIKADISENTTAINNKVDKVTGKGLSTNDFTTTLKNKLNELSNYDDTSIKADIAETSEKTALNRSTIGFQRKNLLKNTAVSGKIYGINFTVNPDGSITAHKGVADKNSGIPIVFANRFTFKANVKYILSGAPDDSSNQTRISLVDDNGGEYGKQDTGKGVLIEFDEDKNYKIRVRFCDRDGEVPSDKTFYPMIRYAEITDDTYESYKPSIEERLTALETAILSEKGE